MIKTLGLKNFKSIEGIDLQPVEGITLLCGSNSCGKSSFLQSILLLKQSAVNLDHRSALTMNGEWVRLGNFEQLVSAQRTKNLITYQLYLAKYGEIELDYEHEPNFGGAVVKRVTARPKHGGNIVIEARGRKHITSYPKVKLPDIEESLEVPYDALRPYYVFGILEPPPSASVFAEQIANVTPGQIEQALKMLTVLTSILAGFEKWLINKVHYLGPIRVPPERFYVVEGTVEIGPGGENAVALLARDRNNKVMMFNPGGKRQVTKSLLEWAQIWLEHFGFSYSIDPMGEKDVLYQINLGLPKLQKKNVSMRDVGYGLSQILPIVVVGLRAKRGDLLVLEQPEIHLHPAIQSKLGDFLLNLARMGKHVIVETHSEHLVNRLRLRVAQDEKNEIQKLVQVLFVEQTDHWRSSIRSLDFDKFGGLDDWPKGFFDSQVSDLRELSTAAMKKLRQVAE